MSDFPEVSENLLWLKPQGMISHDNQPVPYDDWLAFGKKLFQLKQATQWAIGDWINYGEAYYGEKYAQALDVTEVSFRTLQNYAWLSKSFPISRRRENLSWSHHAAVKGIKDETEQDALLDIAESQQMGRDELRDVVKKYKNPDPPPALPPPYRVISGWLCGLDNRGDEVNFYTDDGSENPTGRVILHLYGDYDDYTDEEWDSFVASI